MPCLSLIMQSHSDSFLPISVELADNLFHTLRSHHLLPPGDNPLLFIYLFNHVTFFSVSILYVFLPFHFLSSVLPPSLLPLFLFCSTQTAVL